MKEIYPLVFESNLHELVWGGYRLQPLKGLPIDERCIGESWEISAVPGSQSVVANGPLAGKTLGEVVEEFGADLIGQAPIARYGKEFPLLVKFIDAQRDLSIQVHPNEEMAQERHGKHGKTEMWYIMGAKPNATLYAGFSKEISDDEYRRRVQDGTITEVLARHEVKAGDVFFIPAGRVHSICSGILLCEIQQSSDITYRLFDYNRLGLDGKPRQLHTQEALKVLDFKVYDSYRTDYIPKEEGAVELVDCDLFTVTLLNTQSSIHRDLRAKDSFVTLSCLQGDCRIRTQNGHTLYIERGHSCLIPACEAEFDIEACSARIRLLEAYAK